MKQRLLKFIVCPLCKRELKLDFWEQFKVVGNTKPEVKEGLLTCSCGMSYPIISGIPRLLPKELLTHELRTHHQGFLARHRGKLDWLEDEKKRVNSNHLKLSTRTSDSFGFQWNAFSDMINQWEKNFRQYFHPLKPSFFKNKLVLDAGCGFGRHTYYSLHYGAEVVAMDVSCAADAAYSNLKDNPKTHVVQADILHPPFKQCFEFIYSIGVLHHIPKGAGAGFDSLVKLLKPNGSIFIWVYGIQRGIHPLRKLVGRLPQKILYGVCWLYALFIYFFFILPRKALGNAPVLGGWMESLPFKSYTAYPFQVVHADAFDTLSAPVVHLYDKGDIKKWLERNKLSKTWVKPMATKRKPEHSWKGFGIKTR